MSPDGFFKYARQRYQLMLDREADFERPWTSDPILQQYRFCNVFREDDRTTRWFRDNVRRPYRHRPDVLTATMIFRWFNRITTGERLKSHDLLWNWDSHRARMVLSELNPLVTGAYIIKTPSGMNKLEGIIWSIEQFLPHETYALNTLGKHGCTLAEATKTLTQFPHIGPFMAYEIVTDLRRTKLLENAPDIMTWANPGPGAARGAGRVLGVDAEHFKSHRAADYEDIQRIMRRLLRGSRVAKNWPAHWPQWEMREVEHTLCEFDKYERIRLGEGRSKRRYTGAQHDTS